MSDMTVTNITLSKTPGKSERVNITEGLADLEADMALIKADLAALLAASNGDGLAVYGAHDSDSSLVASAAIFSTYASAAGPHHIVDAIDNALLHISIKNTGSNALDWRVRRRAFDGATIDTSFANGTLAAGVSTSPPIEGVAFAGRYEVTLQAASATTATIESLVKSP